MHLASTHLERNYIIILKGSIKKIKSSHYINSFIKIYNLVLLLIKMKLQNQVKGSFKTHRKMEVQKIITEILI